MPLLDILCQPYLEYSIHIDPKTAIEFLTHLLVTCCLQDISDGFGQW